MKNKIKKMLSRHPEGLTTKQIAALVRCTDSAAYSVMKDLRLRCQVATDIDLNVPRMPLTYRAVPPA